MTAHPSPLRHILRAAATLLAAAVVTVSWIAFGLWHAWRSVDRIEFDTGAAREALNETAEPMTVAAPGADDPAPSPTSMPDQDADRSDSPAPVQVAEPVLLDSDVQTFLVIGSDARDGLGGERADVIILVLVPSGDHAPVMVSLPRDLYLPNRCSGQLSRINASLNGCGEEATGPEMVAITVEDFTGIPIDHFVRFGLEGFTTVIDRLGGIEVCVDHPVRDGPGTPLLFPAGCTVATGEQMLAWVRSRHTQELIDGRWQTIAGINDLHRNRRQRGLLVDMLAQLKQFRSVTDLANLAEELAGAFTLDDGLSLSNAIGIAWQIRDVDPAEILQPEIPVRDHVTGSGAMVLIPEAPFAEVLRAAGAEGYLGG
jgi:LCP family protein required for cell wall assembly